MIPHRDEILRPAVSTDATAVPRYNLVRPDGTIIEKNVAMRLSNPVAREGTPISKAALDEMLAASGVTAGTATAYTLAQEEYTLFDGAPVRFRLHVASGDGATLNINGTGAKPLRDMMGAAIPGGIPADTWLTAYYSAAAGAYVLAGGEAVRALYGERYTVDDAAAYVKDVPGDALPYAEVGEIGGMTYKINVGTDAAPVYELRSAAVSEMKSVGVNLFDLNDFANENGFDAQPDGTYKSSGVSRTMWRNTGKKSGRMYLSYEGRAESGQPLIFQCFYTDGTTQYGGSILVQADNNKYTFATQEGRTVDYMQWTYAEGGTYYVKNMMLSFIDTDYTPYFHDTLPIPEAVRALDGYGWGINETVRNYVDWKNRKFVKMVERVDLGTLNWVAYSMDFRTSSITDYKYGKNGLCAKYSIVAERNVDKSLYMLDTWYGYSTIAVKDSGYTDAATFKAAMSGVMLYYELATPIITDISDILPKDNLVRVQNGGTITPINEYGYAVPTKITYQRDVLANRASIFALEKLRLAMELLASIDEVTPAVSAAIAAAVAPLAKANLSNASGTFGGAVKANASAVSALGTAQVRNVTISNVDLTAGSSALATGDSYRVYS